MLICRHTHTHTHTRRRFSSIEMQRWMAQLLISILHFHREIVAQLKHDTSIVHVKWANLLEAQWVYYSMSHTQSHVQCSANRLAWQTHYICIFIAFYIVWFIRLALFCVKLPQFTIHIPMAKLLQQFIWMIPFCVALQMRDDCNFSRLNGMSSISPICMQLNYFRNDNNTAKFNRLSLCLMLIPTSICSVEQDNLFNPANAQLTFNLHMTSNNLSLSLSRQRLQFGTVFKSSWILIRQNLFLKYFR